MRPLDGATGRGRGPLPPSRVAPEEASSPAVPVVETAHERHHPTQDGTSPRRDNAFGYLPQQTNNRSGKQVRTWARPAERNASGMLRAPIPREKNGHAPSPSARKKGTPGEAPLDNASPVPQAGRGPRGWRRRMSTAVCGCFTGGASTSATPAGVLTSGRPKLARTHGLPGRATG